MIGKESLRLSRALEPPKSFSRFRVRLCDPSMRLLGWDGWRHRQRASRCARLHFTIASFAGGHASMLSTERQFYLDGLKVPELYRNCRNTWHIQQIDE